MDILGLFSVPNWLLILVAAIIAYKIYIGWYKDTFRKMGVPLAEGGTTVLGHFVEYGSQGMNNIDKKWVKKYGNVYGTFEGRFPVLVTCDEDMMKQILVKDFSGFADRRDDLGTQAEMSKALSNLKGERWKEVRTLLNPAFSSGKIKQMMPLIHSASAKLIVNTRLKLKETDILDCKRIFGGYTMDVIASTAFGIEVDSQSNPSDPVVKYASKMFKFNNIFGMITGLFPFMAPLLSKLGFSILDHQSRKFFSKFVREVIAERQQSRHENRDILELMLEASQDDKGSSSSADKGLSTDEIIAQSLIFFIAGYETTASTLCLLTHNLAFYPDKQEQLYEKIREKLGSEKASYEKIQELDCLDMYINETLRMYPPAPRLERLAAKDTEIKGIKIPKGMLVEIPVSAIHYSTEYWKDPEKFMPERFSPEEKSKISPLHFMPFGYGPRHCIGMRLAYTEAKVALADFVRNFKVSVCEKTQNPPDLTKIGLIAPTNVWLKIEERT